MTHHSDLPPIEGAKYIFLDIDGPLNTGRNDYLDPDKYGHHFDNMAVNNLRRIVDRTGARIVVSSSWRHLGLERLQDIWNGWGMPGEIEGFTPGIWGEDRVFDTRGEEIKQWLKENAGGSYSYVVLDDMDDSEAVDGQSEYWIQVDPHCGISFEDADNAIRILNRIDDDFRQRIKRIRRKMKIVLLILLAIVVGKALWVYCATINIGSFEAEKNDILRRRSYLLDKIITTPQGLIDAMPSLVGSHFQGEWAIYSTSMLSAALTNIAKLYPETREEAVEKIDSLIKITMSPELRQYDASSWGEDPLETLSGDKSHISYISLLAWMISGYKTLGGDSKYNALFDSLCEAMARRIMDSPDLNLQTFPRTYIFVPDMLVAIVALANYSKLNGGKYQDVVDLWLANMQANHMDPETGLIKSLVPDGETWVGNQPVLGSYSALSIYYLTFVDAGFAREQYELLKKAFLKKHPFTGFREHVKGTKGPTYVMDSGPVIFGLSPTGTAFGIGGATYFQDTPVRKRFLKSGEWAGFSVFSKHSSHYLLANFVPVGEAITLAMRTAVPWY